MVATWNIDARAQGLEARLARLVELGVDVALLQEVPRRARHQLFASDFAWAELAVLHSEPHAGPGARQGPAILGSSRAWPREAGQVPAEAFVDAGDRAGLTEPEVHNIGWRHKTLYVDADLDGVNLRVCSFHARPGSGLGPLKQLFHRVCAQWLASCGGPLVVGVDANSPRIDHPDPRQWQPFLAGEGTLIGPQPAHQCVDALRAWLDADPTRWDDVRRDRPDGPLAVSYHTPRTHEPRRYDHLLITPDITVDTITHRPPAADGSDHGPVLAHLTVPAPEDPNFTGPAAPR